MNKDVYKMWIPIPVQVKPSPTSGHICRRS